MSSGQPSVENGQRPELNQVSKMSGSCCSSAAGRPHTSQALGPAASAETVTWPSGQYQAGIRWPHHSWRRHVPVADVRQPVLPDLLESLGHDARSAVAGRRERRLGERLRADEPLGLEARLDDVVRALAAPDQHLVRSRADEIAPGLEVRDDPRARAA